MESFWMTAVKIAGLGAICAFVFLTIYKGILGLPIFSTLKKDHQYRLLMLMTTLTFSLAITGLAAYVIRGWNGQQRSEVAYELRLQHNGKPLLVDFEALLLDSNLRRKSEGENGRALVKLPDTLSSIDSIQIKTPCYAQSDSGPFRLIEDQPIVIAMSRIQTSAPDPLPPFAYPDPRNVIPSSAWPTEAAMTVREDIEPQSHVLEIRNASQRSLYLMLFNYRRFEEGAEPWRVLHSGACDGTVFFSEFAEANGLFGIILLEADNLGFPNFAGNLDAYAAVRTALVVEKDGDSYRVNTQ